MGGPYRNCVWQHRPSLKMAILLTIEIYCIAYQWSILCKNEPRFKIQPAVAWLWAGPPREILQGGIRLHWGPRDRLRLISKFRIWRVCLFTTEHHRTPKILIFYLIWTPFLSHGHICEWKQENVLFFTQKNSQNILISKKTNEVYLIVTSNNTILQLMKPY